MEPCAPPAWRAFWKHPLGEVPVMGRNPDRKQDVFIHVYLSGCPLMLLS